MEWRKPLFQAFASALTLAVSESSSLRVSARKRSCCAIAFDQAVVKRDVFPASRHQLSTHNPGVDGARALLGAGEDEVLTEVHIPALDGWGFSNQKFNRRSEDWAMVGVCVVVKVSDGTTPAKKKKKTKLSKLQKVKKTLENLSQQQNL